MLEFQNESNVFFYTLNTLLDSKKMPILSRRQGWRTWRNLPWTEMPTSGSIGM